ncbi:MAG: hypothetical protein A2176_11515 [Spirochaetes bacterium RBG_13_51_14]|nr:MAG: hypothetical protein A2176_11515 [Spirochaetes bacterium RBG_13_51_14]
MKIKLFIAAAFFFACVSVRAQEGPGDRAQSEHLLPTGEAVINIPTAYTMYRASYNFNVFVYDQGGVQLKAFVGVHDNIYFGISFDMQHALGGDTLKPHIPGAVAKIKLVDGFRYVPAIAIGYDSFYEGKNGIIDNAKSFYNKLMNGPYFVFINPYVYVYRKNEKKDLYYNDYNTILHGPYIVFTSPIYLFKSEQFIVYGVRMPVQPEFRPHEASYFFGLDIPLGRYFRIKAELERVFWDLRRPDEWFVNCGARVVFFDQLGIEFDLLIESGEQLNRVLKIEYRGEF